jgi:hypothetical protein
MVQKSKLLAALDAHKARDPKAEHQKKLEKKARKRAEAKKNTGIEEVEAEKEDVSDALNTEHGGISASTSVEATVKVR